MHVSKFLPWLCCVCLSTACQARGLEEEVSSPLTAALALDMKNGDELPLWGEQAPPGANGTTAALLEEVLSDSGTATDPQRTIDHIKTPTITAYLPERSNGAAVLITAGGGYTNLVIDKEGRDIAEWATSLGIKAFVL